MNEYNVDTGDSLTDSSGNYIPNTHDQLGDRFGNCVANYMMLRKLNSADESMASESRESFIGGVELIIEKLGDGRLVEREGIGQEQLRAVLDVANKIDWATAEGLRELYKTYGEILNDEYDPEFLEKIE